MSSLTTYPGRGASAPLASNSGHQLASRASMSAPGTSEPRLERGAAPADGVVLLDLAGELDLVGSARLRELIGEAAAERPELVVADLPEVGFMDSTVLRELLRAH